MSNSIPVTSSGPAVSGTAADFTAPRTQSWMFSVQRTVGAWLLEGDYNGSHGDHLVLSGEFTPALSPVVRSLFLPVIAGWAKLRGYKL